MTATAGSVEQRGSSRGRRGTRYPLHVTIATVFAGLLLLVGLGLIAYNYAESRRIALLSADDQVRRIGAQVAGEIAQLYVPAQNLVDLSAQVLDADDLDAASRPQTLGYLVEALRLNENLDALYVGNEQGDFLLVRPLGPDKAATRILDAPATARWAVQHMDRRDDEVVDDGFVFLDEQLFEIGASAQRSLDFDPRVRDWYRSAIHSSAPVTTEVYPFFTTREVGVTFSRRLARGSGVTGADLNLSDFTAGLAAQRITASTRVAVVDGVGTIIGLADPRKDYLTIHDTPEGIELAALADLDDPLYGRLQGLVAGDTGRGREILAAFGREWFASVTPLPSRSRQGLYLAMLIPLDELLAEVIRVRNQSLVISLVLLLIALALAVWLARSIAGSLHELAAEAEHIRRFQLDAPIDVSSRITEVDDLAETMAVMKTSLRQFLAISEALSAEKDYGRVLEMILQEARAVTAADAGAVLMRDDERHCLQTVLLIHGPAGLHYGGSRDEPPPADPVPLAGEDDEDRPRIDRHTATSGKTLSIDDVTATQDYDLDGLRARFDIGEFRSRSMLSVPLRDQKGQIIGILQLVNARSDEGAVVPFRPELVAYVTALASEAAVGLDVRRLLEAQRRLLDAFIHVIASAIDAKSPYTSGHCQRVPALARMLTEAAHEAPDGPFKDFRLDDDDWYQLHLASWLHDCGKVTTPEYVVDKATKLETIYDRIHEIRMRFELLWRDAQLDYHRSLAEGDATDEAALRQKLDDRLARIREDFEFIAACNQGGEFMADDHIERIRSIASQRWTRHLDDRLGISRDELERKRREPAAELPVDEPLLADREEHIFYRDPSRHPYGDNTLGFRMPVPEHEYNRGEIYNLCIRKGTLTDEERFKINDHIVQTMIMLKQLPFPTELDRVPDWAANHHEKMDGTGYPRRLTGDQMSVPERIMAIADIFEALTAADRPYKSGKTLGEALRIMSFMRNDAHIDAELFDLFLESRVWERYGKEHLAPTQIDEVDIARFRSKESPDA